MVGRTGALRPGRTWLGSAHQVGFQVLAKQDPSPVESGLQGRDRDANGLRRLVVGEALDVSQYDRQAQVLGQAADALLQLTPQLSVDRRPLRVVGLVLDRTVASPSLTMGWSSAISTLMGRSMLSASGQRQDNLDQGTSAGFAPDR